MGVEKYPNNKIRAMEINIDGEYVDTLDRFNNAKRSEVDDRVKHSV